jgi:TPR repeat protein
MHNLATMYLDRSGVNPDPARGIELLTRAANLGFEVSQLRLGLAYLSGESVPRDPQLGLAWVKRAAKHHLAGAEFVLGSAYENGFGTKPNLARAAELYRDSAAQGSPAAQNNLGRLYLEGRGVTKNTRESVRLFRASAEHGNAQSYFNLALCSLTACDGVQDVTAAYAWYLSGARFIQPPPADFQAQFSHLAAQLTPDQIRDAESISQAWVAKHPAADPHEPLQLNHVPGMTTIIAGNSRIDTFPNEVVNRLWLQTQFTQAPSLNPASEH